MFVSLYAYYYISIFLTLLFSISISFLSKVYSQTSLVLIPFSLLFFMLILFKKKHKYISVALFFSSFLGFFLALKEIFLSRDFLLFSDLMTFASFLFLHKIKNPNYYRIIISLSLIVSFSGVLLDPNVVVYILFIFYLVFAAFSLNAVHLFLLSSSYLDKKINIGSSYFVQIFRAAPLGFFCAFLVFLVFPRVNRLHIHLPFVVKNRFQVGYTGNISFQNFSDFTIDSSKVMQIKSSDRKWLKKNFSHLYLKGEVFDTFDGVTWTNTFKDKKPYLLSSSLDHNISYHEKKILNLDIISNPMFNRVIFLPEGSHSLTNISYSIGGLFLNEKNLTLERKFNDPMRFFYSLIIKKKIFPKDITLSLFSTKSLSKNHSFYSFYKDSPLLAIPHKINNTQYFKEFKKNFFINNSTLIQDLLYDIQLFFKENYKASLLNKKYNQRNFESFLTIDKKGHCEYFASAAVLLLRSFGIPSRIVAGYKGGSYNSVADIAIIRQSDAHAWVEFFIPSFGWFVFDPTPFVEFNEEEFYLYSEAKKYFNALNFWLNLYLVDYDFQQQRKLFDGTKNIFLAKKLNRSDFDFLFSYFLYLIIFMIFSVLFIRRYLRKRSQRYPHYYFLFIDYLNKVGSKVQKRSYESFFTFCQRLEQENIVDKTIIADFLYIIEYDLYSKKNPLTSNLDKNIASFTNKIKNHIKL